MKEARLNTAATNTATWKIDNAVSDFAIPAEGEDKEFNNIIESVAIYIERSNGQERAVIELINCTISEMPRKQMGRFIEHCIIAQVEAEDGYTNMAALHCISHALEQLTK